MKDSISALRDAALGVLVGEAPVRKYSTELKSGLSSRLAIHSRKIEQHGRLISQKKKRRSKIIERLVRRCKTGNDKNVRAFEKQLGLEKKALHRYGERSSSAHSPAGSAKSDYEKSQKNFILWRDAIGRPPYAEKYRSIIESLRLKGDENSAVRSESASEEGKSFFERINGIIYATIVFVALPLDVVYTKPGFFAILNDNFIAYAAAVLYVLVLVNLGQTIRVLYRFAFSRSLLSSPANEVNTKLRGSESAPTVKVRSHRAYAALLFVTIVIAIIAVYAGATIRSFVPEVASINQRIDVTRSTIQRERELQQFENPDVLPANNLIESNLAKIDLEQELFLEVVSAVEMTLSADSLLAIVLYSTVVFATLIAGLSKTDPIFEYYLAYEEYALSKVAMLQQEGVVASTKQAMEVEIEKSELEISNLKSQSFGPDDVVDDSSVQKIDDAIEKLEAEELEMRAAQEGFTIAMDEQVKLRCLRYAKFFARLKRDRSPVEEWKFLFAENLDHNFDDQNSDLTKR